MKYSYIPSLLCLLFILFFAGSAHAQPRDFVTDAEAEIIREFQEVDLRIDALVRFIDRRLAAAGISGHQWSLPKRNSEMWGEEPKGTRTQLLSDIRRILQKSIDDLDDIASRDTSSIEGNEKSGKLFPKAVRNLAKNAERFRGIFNSELRSSTNEAEKGLLQQSIEFCDQIIEAAATLPAEIKKSKKDS